MRRQARLSVGGALVVRSASALQVWLWLLIFIFQNEFRISRSIQPGYLDFDNLPETNFTCAGKVIGGYYADLETSCQMFHVCTVGQQEEPMDIKFLCLNGTVFDQETRVCERVDEVDCTKSEKFYSLNLELYGSTLAPPMIQADQNKPQAESTEQSSQHTKPKQDNSDHALSGSTSTSRDKTTEHFTDAIDSTDDPIQDIKKEEQSHKQGSTLTHPSLPLQEEFEEEYEYEIDSENPEYEDYSHAATTTKTTTVQAPTSTTTTRTTTTASTTVSRPSTTTTLPSSTSAYLPPINHFVSSPVPTRSTVASSSSHPSSSASSSQSLDPALLSPQEFIYHHGRPGADAISFQRQSFRPADGVYITHAPQQQFDHFQYELSRTAPRPAQSRPAPFVQRPQPFRPTTIDPRDQLMRPGPTSQSSERHEMAVKHRPQPYPSILPAQRPLPFNPYFYDRKRSDDVFPENQSSLSARSVAPPPTTEKPPSPPKPKSPPRVIVTASASVSDSTGKRLNYTVGNVVSAVKPIVPINYDNYKESDLIFDPFFLDVPKLQNRRKTRSNKNHKVIAIGVPATVSTDLPEKRRVPTASSITSQATTIKKSTTQLTTTTTTVAWNPDDYVDDNYEPQAYHIPPIPPIAVLKAYDQPNNKKEEKLIKNSLGDEKTLRLRSKINRFEQSKPTPSAEQKISSQSASAIAPPPPAALLPPPPAAAHPCASSRTADCHIRA